MGNRQLSDLTNQKHIYEALLEDVCSKVDLQTAQHIEQVVNEVGLSFSLCFPLYSPSLLFNQRSTATRR